MNYNRLDLIKASMKFFIQLTWMLIIYIFCSIVAYNSFKVYGLVFVFIIASIGIGFFYAKNLYYLISDIYHMNIREFKGKITYLEYSSMRNILPCGIYAKSHSKKNKQSYGFHYSKKVKAKNGDIVEIEYLDKFKIIITVNVIE